MTRRVVGDVDWERLEAEFADVDAEFGAAASLADRILAAVRARRARRRVLLVVAGTMIAAGLVVLVLLAVLPGGAPAGPVAGVGGVNTATRAQIYAAALSGVPGSSGVVHISHGAAEGGAAAAQPAVQPIRVSERLCRVPTRGIASSCTGGRIPPAVRRQVKALLGGRVQFIAAPSKTRQPADMPVIALGPLVVHGKHAELVEFRCTPRCGVEQTLRLREKAGHWQLS